MTKHSTKVASNPEDIGRFYDLLGHPGNGITEIRLLNPADRKDVRIAFINNRERFVDIARKYSGELQVYAGLQPRQESMGGRSLNRVVRGALGAKDADITHVTVIAFDVDPVRPADTGATNAEVKAALAVCEKIISLFEFRGFKRPCLISSGNGGQIVASIPVTPMTPELAAQIRAFEGEIKKFGTDTVKIDTISNPSRILRIVGTRNIKGDGGPERPHRLSRPLTPLVRDEDPALLSAIQAIPVTTDTKDVAMSINLKGALPEPDPWTMALIESDDHLNDLYNGVGKTEGDTSSSGYDASLAAALAVRGVPPEQIAAVLASRPDGRARRKGKRYIVRTVERAISVVAEDADTGDAVDATTPDGANAAAPHSATGTIDFAVQRVVIYDSIPPSYEFHIAGKVLKLSTDDLLKPGRFTRTFVDHLHRIPQLPPKKRWNRFINRLLAGAVYVHQPPEASPELFLRGEIVRIMDNLPPGQNRDDLEHGKSITMNGALVFTLRTVKQVVHETVEPTSVRDLAVQLRAIGCKPFKPTIDGKQIRVWARPPTGAVSPVAAMTESAAPENPQGIQEVRSTLETPVAATCAAAEAESGQDTTLHR